MGLLYNPNLEPTGKLTTKEQLEKISNEQEGQRKKMERQRQEIVLIRWIMIAVIIVLLVALIGALLTVYSIIQDYIGTKTAVTQNLVNKIDEQSSKVNLLEQNCIKIDTDLTKLKTYFGIK